MKDMQYPQMMTYDMNVFSNLKHQWYRNLEKVERKERVIQHFIE